MLVIALTITAFLIPLLSGYLSSSPASAIVLDERYQYTPVLRFSTNYNTSVQYDYPIGSKIRIQTKWTVPGYPGVGWYDAGYAEITIDAGVTSPWHNSGPQITEAQFEFKYQHSYLVGSGPGVIEAVYAVDTSNDPRGWKEVQYSWDGQPVSGVVYTDTLQNHESICPIKGGSTYVFSMGISLPRANISLGVTLPPFPQGTLTIKAGSWYPGYMARTVSLGDGSYQDSRSFWVSSS